MDISKLSQCGTIRKYDKDSFVCIEGNEGHTAFLVLKGSVNVMLGTFSNKHRNMATIPTGAFFGEMSMLEDTPRSATIVTAEDDVILLEINKDDFIKLVKTDPELAYNILRTLYNRIEDTMNSAARYLVAYNAEIRRNHNYVEMGTISLQQFIVIIAQKEDYVIKLLRYLSHTLADLNKELMRRVTM